MWSVRLFPSRSASAAACKAGHVRVNGERAKPATGVGLGDQVHVRGGRRERIVVARQLLVKRVGAALAVEAYDDHSPPPPGRSSREGATFAVRQPGSGRPTKAQRRQLDKLRGRSSN
ncbi:MAG: S4 domain-containing protein [Micrococcales bacterium]|nr:S4 domain-containing protein [Micrococcales bacterium]